MTIRKTINGEFLTSTATEDEIDSALLEANQDLLGQMGRHWNIHSLLFLKRASISRLLFLNTIYQKIITTPGYILEFGVQWGSTLNVLTHLRGIYEPYNYSRKIIGFDTFEGFVEVTKEDGNKSVAGDYRTLPEYEATLEKILCLQEMLSPISHIKKHELVKGDVCTTLQQWKKQHNELVVALAFFDMDLYKPTKHALEEVLGRCVKGSVLVFDEFNCEKFPGETQAVFEVLGGQRMKRDPNMPYCAYYEIE
jgi:hypothetical protein